MRVPCGGVDAAGCGAVATDGDACVGVGVMAGVGAVIGACGETGGRNRGRGALRSVSHWGLEGAAGYASGRHRLTGDRLGRALGEDRGPVVLA